MTSRNLKIVAAQPMAFRRVSGHGLDRRLNAVTAVIKVGSDLVDGPCCLSGMLCS